jgi:hypothetical protein
MSGKRVLQIGIGIGIVVAALMIVQPFAEASGVSQANGTAMQKANRLYELGERYGESPEQAVPVSALRLYEMGERYGQVPGIDVPAKALRLYELGERYGETP